MSRSAQARRLVLVLGDQLDERSAAFADFDPACDVVWMAEASDEATQVWSHKARIALFLAAMRQFRRQLLARGWRVDYTQLDEAKAPASLAAALEAACRRWRPAELVVVEPGEWRVRQALDEAARAVATPLSVRTDRHFFATLDDFAAHAAGRKQLRMEFYYRELRRRTGVLMHDGRPIGGRWNFDTENRQSFGRQGPGRPPPPPRFAPDALTADVLRLVDQRFADHPGSLADFAWPVTRTQALAALDDFVERRLPQFGPYQDALWTDEPFLYHAQLAAALNLKLLDPRDVVERAVAAHAAGRAPLASVEGFVRQILGWREYVRGVYWRFMPEYLDRNELGAEAPLPNFYWTGATEMACLRHAIGQTLRHGYAHHIQRLMVTGLFALLLGVAPQQVHRWYLAVYVDAVEWVELPNTLGMSQYADGGVMASKPYVATGKYIDRMSNYCVGCRFDPARATGPDACPFTTLYWDFLARHRRRFQSHTRMALQVRNLARWSDDERRTIARQAAALRARLMAE